MKFGIIGAMEVEVTTLKEHMTNKKVTQKAGMEFVEGKLGKMDVVVVKCGVGKVNAALCVQVLADCFAVTHVINTGIAGSLSNALDIGDILVSEVAIQHDMNVSVFGYPLGLVPGMKEVEIKADPMLSSLAIKAGEKLKKENEAFKELNMVAGRVVSGDQFISSPEKKKWLIDTFSGDCCEMEGASIAQAATLNNLPFVILRAISDKADGSAQMDYPTFEKLSAKRCACLVEEMMLLYA